MHPRAAHLLQRGVLADHHLDHPRAAQVHRRVAVDHGHEVAERGDVGAARSRRPEQRAHLRDRAGRADLGVEDLARAAPSGEHLHLIGDARPGGVDQVDHRHAGRVGLLDDPDDLLDGPGAPRARLDRGVVRHQRDRTATDRGGAGDHTVGREPVGQHVRERAVLGETAVVDQQLDAVPAEHLAPRGGLLVVPGCAALADPGPDLGQLGVAGAAGLRCLRSIVHGGERTEFG